MSQLSVTFKIFRFELISRIESILYIFSKAYAIIVIALVLAVAIWLQFTTPQVETELLYKFAWFLGGLIVYGCALGVFVKLTEHPRHFLVATLTLLLAGGASYAAFQYWTLPFIEGEGWQLVLGEMIKSIT